MGVVFMSGVLHNYVQVDQHGKLSARISRRIGICSILVSFCIHKQCLYFFQTVEFWREAEILSKLHHPNVVAFYGVVQDGPGGTLATVAEFMVNGSLRHVLLSKDR